MRKSDPSNPSLRFDSDEATYRASFDPDADSASDAVVQTLAAITDQSADELEPIRSVVDPIVFDSLVRRQRRPISVKFVYSGHEVTVESGGEIVVREAQPDGGAEYMRSFGDDRSPSGAVIEAVAAAKNEDPLALEPLCEQLDPDALDELVNSSAGEHDLELRVSFRVSGLRVDISGDRRVVVTTPVDN
jgi:hypothetical protein